MRCADLGSGLRARTTSAKERVGCCDAHRGSNRGKAWRRMLGVAGRRRVAAALGGSRCGGEIRASGWHGPMRGVTVKQAEVLAGLGEPRRRGIERRPTHPRRRCPEQSRRCTGRSRRKRVWRGSWARGGTIAVVGEGWKGAVWPVRDGAEDLRGGAVWSEGGKAALGFGSAAVGWEGRRGEDSFYRAANLGVRARDAGAARGSRRVRSARPSRRRGRS